MSSVFSDTPPSDWSSTSNTLRASSSQSSQTSVDARLDPPKIESLQSSLSSSWANYLSAQHCNREVATLKRHFDEQIRQINALVTVLQHDLGNHQRLAAAAASESKTVHDKIRADLEQLLPLRERLPSLEHDVSFVREQVRSGIPNLRENATTLQERLDRTTATTSTDIATVKAQYASALEIIEFLQGELRDLRAEKQRTEEKVSVLECQIDAIVSTPTQIPTDAVSFLAQLLVRKDEVVRLLDSPKHVVSEDITIQSGEYLPHLFISTSMVIIIVAAIARPRPVQGPPPLPKIGSQHRPIILDGNPPPQPRKRKPEDPSMRPTKRPTPSTITQEQQSMDSTTAGALRSLLDGFREEYKRNPPKSDASLIWKFLDSINDAATSKHLQESLVQILPGRVTRRELRNKNSRRFVYMSEGLSWKDFTRALRAVPPMEADTTETTGTTMTTGTTGTRGLTKTIETA